MARKKNTDGICTYGEFLSLFPLCVEEHREELLARLREQPSPETLCGKEVMKSLGTISYGMLDDLHDAARSEDFVGECCKTLLDIEPARLAEADVNDVFGFASFVTRELERINRLFGSIRTSYSREEKEAGVESLSFGSFGVLDWYAQRMGISNQNEVRDVPWVRIYTCMKNDNAKGEYERRLHQVYMKRTKAKGGRGGRGR